MRRSGKDSRRVRQQTGLLTVLAVVLVGLVSFLAWPTLGDLKVPVLTAPGVAAAGSNVIATPDHPLRVLLIGDSLAWEAQGSFASALTAGKRATVESQVFGGTALCDFLPGLPAELTRFKPEAVVLEFTGNEFTPCTKDPATGHPLSRVDLVAKYGADAGTAAAMFRDAGVAVYWADTPTGRWGDPISAQVVEAASRSSEAVTPTRRINAATAVLNRGAYTDTLPCLSGEPCASAGPGTRGLARVRSPDGEHFCPAKVASVYGAVAPCPVFSPGAWRYGRALAAPLLLDYRL